MTTNTTDLKFYTLEDLLTEPFPKREYLLEPLMKQNESMMIWAAPGVGKTMFTLTLAIAIAGGGSVIGWSAPKPYKVLLIDGEMPIQDLQERMNLLIRSVDNLNTEAANQNLTILSRHAQQPDTPFTDFSKEESWRKCLAWIIEQEFDLVILDNLSTLAYIEDENSASAVTVIVKFLQAIKQADIGCIVVHHSNKGGSAFRGSSNLATTFEVIMGLMPKEDLMAEQQGASFETVLTKFRGKKDPTLTTREVKLVETDGKPEWTYQVSQDETLEAIACVIRSGEVRKQSEIAAQLPNRFWPNPEKAPSVGWISKQVNHMKAKDIMTDEDIESAYRTASPEEEDDDF